MVPAPSATKISRILIDTRLEQILERHGEVSQVDELESLFQLGLEIE